MPGTEEQLAELQKQINELTKYLADVTKLVAVQQQEHMKLLKRVKTLEHPEDSVQESLLQ